MALTCAGDLPRSSPTAFIRLIRGWISRILLE